MNLIFIAFYKIPVYKTFHFITYQYYMLRVASQVNRLERYSDGNGKTSCNYNLQKHCTIKQLMLNVTILTSNHLTIIWQ